MSRERAGLALCLISVLGYSSASVFAKYAYAGGANVVTLLALRYSLAAILFWVLVRILRQPLPPIAVANRSLLLGGVLYAGQAGLYFAAIDRMNVSLTSMICYVYPAMVAAGSVVLGRERFDARRTIALAASLTGVILVLVGGGGGSLNAAGALLALGSAVAYTLYLLIGHPIMVRVAPLSLSALLCTGAAVSYVVTGAATRSLAFDVTSSAWLAIAAMTIFSTIVAVATSLAAIARVGPTVNSIVMTLEVPLNVAYGTLLFGEHLTPIQALGGLIVLAGVMLLNLRLPWARIAANFGRRSRAET
jgi:drug/metabolite transporter (DMT)-like permease